VRSFQICSILNIHLYDPPPAPPLSPSPASSPSSFSLCILASLRSPFLSHACSVLLHFLLHSLALSCICFLARACCLSDPCVLSPRIWMDIRVFSPPILSRRHKSRHFLSLYHFLFLCIHYVEYAFKNDRCKYSMFNVRLERAFGTCVWNVRLERTCTFTSNLCNVRLRCGMIQ